jgi:Family of unknown function (DUF6279)
MWQVDRYFGLSEQQHELVARQLDELHRWHRQSQLSQYATFLREIDDQVRNPVDPADLAEWRERIKTVWPPLAEHIAPAMAQFLVTVRLDQIERLESRMAEANRKYRKEHLPAKVKLREEARADRLVERAEFFFGKLSDQQESELRVESAALPANEEAWLAERVDRQRAFVALVKRIQRDKPAPEIAEQICRDYLLALWQGRDVERRARLDAMLAAEDAMSVGMLNRASVAQRAYLSSKLLGIAKDFNELAVQ